jgi:hypothetical protein
MCKITTKFKFKIQNLKMKKENKKKRKEENIKEKGKTPVGPKASYSGPPDFPFRADRPNFSHGVRIDAVNTWHARWSLSSGRFARVCACADAALAIDWWGPTSPRMPAACSRDSSHGRSVHWPGGGISSLFARVTNLPLVSRSHCGVC